MGEVERLQKELEATRAMVQDRMEWAKKMRQSYENELSELRRAISEILECKEGHFKYVPCDCRLKLSAFFSRVAYHTPAEMCSKCDAIRAKLKKHEPCRINLAGWCDVHNAKGRLLEIEYCEGEQK